MANTISEIASVYAYRREAESADARTSPIGAVSPAQQQNTGTTARPAEVSAKHSEELASILENLPGNIQRNLEFSVDEDTGHSVIKVVDADTGELVRQIPPDQVLHIISQAKETLEDMRVGVLLDDKF